MMTKGLAEPRISSELWIRLFHLIPFHLLQNHSMYAIAPFHDLYLASTCIQRVSLDVFAASVRKFLLLRHVFLSAA